MENKYKKFWIKAFAFIALLQVGSLSSESLLVTSSKNKKQKKIKDQQLVQDLFEALQATTTTQNKLLKISKQCIECSTSQKQRQKLVTALQHYQSCTQELQNQIDELL